MKYLGAHLNAFGDHRPSAHLTTSRASKTPPDVLLMRARKPADITTDLAEQHIPAAPPRSQSIRGTLQSPTTCFQPQVPRPNITRTEFPEVLHDPQYHNIWPAGPETCSRATTFHNAAEDLVVLEKCTFGARGFQLLSSSTYSVRRARRASLWSILVPLVLSASRAQERMMLSHHSCLGYLWKQDRRCVVILRFPCPVSTMGRH